MISFIRDQKKSAGIIRQKKAAWDCRERSVWRGIDPNAGWKRKSVRAQGSRVSTMKGKGNEKSGRKNGFLPDSI